MAYRDFQTAAARVVHLVEPSDQDVRRLATEYHFHPLDLEAILSINPKPRVSGYQHYVTASLPWPVLNGRHSVIMSELQLFIGADFLIIADDGLLVDIRDSISSWETAGSNTDSPAMLAYTLLVQLLKATAADCRAVPAAEWLAVLRPLQTALDRSQQLLDDQGWLPTAEDQNAFAFLRYSLGHLLEHIAERPIEHRPPAAKKRLVTTAVTGYALASAITTVMVVLFISFRR